MLLIVLGFGSVSQGQPACVSEEEKKLYELAMQYRKSKNIKAIPFSVKLTQVAQAHVRDLTEQFDYENRGDCNPHSWSAKGIWSACCYTNDHKQAKCMWDKPKEIAGYSSEGFEIAFYSSAVALPEEALDGWKKSAGHNPLLVNSGSWEKLEWKAIGIGIYKNYAVVWFGQADDKSQMTVCP